MASIHYSDPSQVDPFIHKSLDSYAFIAITGSRETLETLIEMVKSDNIFRQGILDTQGQALARRISVCGPLVFTGTLLTNPFSMERRASKTPYTN